MAANGYRILDTLQASILCLDPTLRVTYVNATAEALFDQSAAHLVGRRFDSLLSRVEHSTILGKLQQPRALTEHEAVITLASGKSIVADYSIYPLGDPPESDDLVLEIRPLQRQAQFAQEELNQLQKQVRDQLARGLAHEINNPLGGIRGAAQLLQRGLDNPTWQEYTEVIINEVDRLRSLIGNMLGPENRISFEPLNILEVLEHIRRIILAAEPDRIRIRRDYDPSIPELEGDRDLLIQAILNIARNAVQAIDGDGEIIFRTRIGSRYTIGQVTHPLVVQIDIVDSGPGIASDLNDTIFLPMVTDKPEGSGLGLPIAQEIVLRHGGTIQMHSTDSGTTFSIILPLEQI
jgi:two-component system nitrogen regulation sensor histidine kinase GlnL